MPVFVDIVSHSNFCVCSFVGILLCLKMSKVRAEKPSSEMGKVRNFCFLWCA